MPTIQRPVDCHPDLTDERLAIIAKALADVRYTTMQEMNSPLDDAYTRECPTFGRQRNALIQMCRSGDYPWLSLVHAGMDLRFKIGKAVCRFFTDDLHRPSKEGFFKRDATDMLFETNDDVPVFFRFVVEKALTDTDEDRVHFVGYNVYEEKVCEWTYTGHAVNIYAVDQVVPTAVELPPAVVRLRESETGSAKAANEG